MSKKIVGDDGKTYVQKKPFYKRVWFWLLVVIVLIVLGGGQGGGSDKKDTSATSSTKATSESASSTSSTQKLSEEDQDKQILADYTTKIQAQTPKSIASYNEKAKSNQDGMQGLAKLSNDEVSVLAKISNEGIEKMAKVMMTTGNGKQYTYKSYAAKLQDVYMAESQKIMDNYTRSATGQ